MCEPADNLPMQEFAEIFGGQIALEDFLEFLGIGYGNPQYDWCATAAEELRKEYLSD